MQPQILLTNAGVGTECPGCHDTEVGPGTFLLETGETKALRRLLHLQVAAWEEAPLPLFTGDDLERLLPLLAWLEDRKATSQTGSTC